ncbi:hypothetical protein [Kitasatospora sp. NPDC093558]|uniref:DsbA family protein n=1 Tax=Kitasatospora sp. NPDC093558 TaxID=3155201 RepID=UPI0034221391
MKIELLLVPDCPHGHLAAAHLREALAETGLSPVSITTHVIADEAEARRVGFTGSPTILVNGRDPFAVEGAPVSVSCRLYRTPEGVVTGAPGVGQLRDALTEAAGR